MYKKGFRTRDIRRNFNVTKSEKELLDDIRKKYKISYIDMLLLAAKILEEGEHYEIKKCN